MAMTSAERQKKLRKTRFSNGLCVGCGKHPPEQNKIRCLNCKSSHKANSASRHAERKLAGLCYCGALAINGFATCKKHLDAASNRHEEIAAISLKFNLCKRCKCQTDGEHCLDCKVIKSNHSKRHRMKLRDCVFAKYGGNKCVCCGEIEPLFLTLDHINNDGAAHRRSMTYGKHATGERFYRWLRDSGFPPGFQVLCMNCNGGKHRNRGVCPHKSKSS